MGFLEVQGATQSQWAFMNTMQKEVFHYPCPQAPLLGPALEAPLPAMNGLGEEQGLQWPREWGHLLHQGSLQNLSFSCVTWTCFQKWLCMAIAPQWHEWCQPYHQENGDICQSIWSSTVGGGSWGLKGSCADWVINFPSWCGLCPGWPFYSERQCFEICLFNKFSVLITGELKTKTFLSYLWGFSRLNFESPQRGWGMDMTTKKINGLYYIL